MFANINPGQGLGHEIFHSQSYHHHHHQIYYYDDHYYYYRYVPVPLIINGEQPIYQFLPLLLQLELPVHIPACSIILPPNHVRDDWSSIALIDRITMTVMCCGCWFLKYYYYYHCYCYQHLTTDHRYNTSLSFLWVIATLDRRL